MIEYADIAPAEIAILKELWIKNKEYHLALEPIFKQQYADLFFEERMKSIFADELKQYKISIARQNKTLAGYCISEILAGTAEIISLHVLESHRKMGIGSGLLGLHLAWIKENNCTVAGLQVSSANAKTIEFYKKHGFCCNTTYMELA